VVRNWYHSPSDSPTDTGLSPGERQDQYLIRAQTKASADPLGGVRCGRACARHPLPLFWECQTYGRGRRVDEQTESTLLPLDFVVSGIPVSRQTTSPAAVQRWQQTVAAAARSAIPRRRGGHDPSTEHLAVTLVYFYRSPPLDTDNMIKPILDAMKGIVYDDDCQVVDLHAAVREMRGSYDLRNVTNALWLAIDAGDPFVYVHVDVVPEPLEALP